MVLLPVCLEGHSVHDYQKLKSEESEQFSALSESILDELMLRQVCSLCFFNVIDICLELHTKSLKCNLEMQG